MSLSPPPSILPSSDATHAAAERAIDRGAEVDEPSIPSSARSPLYHRVWRWHFFAGLIVSPVLLVASLTGAIYVFKSELSNWIYADLYFVEPVGDSVLSYDEQQRAAQKAAGDLEIEGVFVSTNPRRSTQFVAHIHEGGDANPRQMHQVFFVDPYRGTVLGSQVLEREFFGVVLELHRTLFSGMAGRILVELATCWGLVLLVTGTYLWWPRGKNRIQGVWLPRTRGKIYAVLRDWHSVVGTYAMPIAALILATGLFFSQVMGIGYFAAISQAGQVPPEVFGTYPAPARPDGATLASLDLVVERMVEQSRPGDMIFLQTSHTDDAAHKAFLMSGDNHNTMRIVAVDRYTGATLDVTDVADLPPMLRLYAMAVAIHIGVVLGMPSKIAAFLTCVVLIGLTVTGVWMWWKRRPPGRFGAPRRPSEPLPRWAKIVIVATGVMLPTLGVSLVLLLAGEAVLRRIARWRNLPA